MPLQVLGDPRMTPKIVKWRAEMAEKNGLRAADEHVKVLSLMLAWGSLLGKVASNPATAVPRLWKSGNREEIIWTAEDCAAFDATPKMPQSLIDLRRLAEFTGLRRADLCALRWDEITDTHIARTAAKKSAGKRRRTIMPLVPGLRELLDELRTRFRKPGVATVLVGTLGGPLAPSTVTTQFHKYRGLANGGAGIFSQSRARRRRGSRQASARSSGDLCNQADDAARWRPVRQPDNYDYGLGRKEGLGNPEEIR